MLLRFLGIATLSITVLTVKAMDATEVYEPPAETPTEISYEIVYTTPVINQTAAFTHEEDKPDHTGSINKGYMPASQETGIGRHLNTAKKQLAGYQRTPPLPVRLRSNADDVKGASPTCWAANPPRKNNSSATLICRPLTSLKPKWRKQQQTQHRQIFSPVWKLRHRQLKKKGESLKRLKPS